MTTVVRGTTQTLYAEFFEFAGGPLDDVTNLTLTITRASDGVVIIGPTSVGIVHTGTGTYTFQWSASASLELGDYVAQWVATEGTASEIIGVIDESDTTGSGACEVWPAIWTCELSAGDIAVTGSALQIATDILWSLSGQRFGLCTSTLRPCRRECSGMSWPGGTTWPSVFAGQTYPLPFWWAGQWLNLTCGSCTSECSCSSVEEVALPGPVYDIVSVRIDGVTLSSTAYRLDDSRLLVRVDGGTWPLCNDLSKNDGAVGTWSITARYGEPVPELGKIAVGELACEIKKALLDEDCGLPQSVVSIARQGVSINYGDVNEAMADGRTGLRFTDMFISAYNPGGLRARARVYDIDGPNPRRTA